MFRFFPVLALFLWFVRALRDDKLYKVLGVDPGVDDASLKKAYRRVV